VLKLIVIILLAFYSVSRREFNLSGIGKSDWCDHDSAFHSDRTVTQNIGLKKVSWNYDKNIWRSK